MQLILGFYGEGDFFTMKGVVEELLEQVGMKKRVHYDAKAGKTFLHPGRQANIVYDGTVIGYLVKFIQQFAKTTIWRLEHTLQ